MAVYTASLDNSSYKYVSSNIPMSIGETSISLVNAEVGSKIDLIHFFGRKGKKVLINFNNISSSSNVEIRINGCKRVVVFDEEHSDYMVRYWSELNSFTFVPSRSTSGTWNSFASYGDFEISSIEVISANLNGTSPSIDIIVLC